MQASILSGEKVNLGRQPEVDLAKVLAILTMVYIHLFEHMPFAEGMYEAYSPFYLFMEFCGGPLSAPLFMSAMGIGLAFTRHRDPASLARRGLRLLAQGYVLNALRRGIPLLIAYDLTQDSAVLLDVAESLLMVDVLQLAGMAFLFFALLLRLKAGQGAILLASVAMGAIATFAGPIAPDSLAVSGVAGLFLYQNHFTFFPLFSWAIYPAVGFCFGNLLQRVQNKARFYGRLLAGSAAAFALLSLLYSLLGVDLRTFFAEEAYYAQGLFITPWILSICGIVYGLLYFASRPVARAQGLARLVQAISAGVNDVYVCQWIIIGWFAVFAAGRMQVTVLGFVALGAAVTVISAALALAVRRMRKRRAA